MLLTLLKGGDIELPQTLTWTVVYKIWEQLRSREVAGDRKQKKKVTEHLTENKSAAEFRIWGQYQKDNAHT